MTSRNLRRAAVVTVAGILGIAATVYGGETDRGGFDLGISTKDPGAAAGLTFHVLYKHPDDPEAKPPSVTSAVFDLPAGMRIDTTAVPACTASDDDFRARGRDACPPETRVGDGKLTVMTGAPGADRAMADIVAFNGEGELVEVVFFEGTNAVAGMDRLTISEGRLEAHPPLTPGGPPDGRTAVRELKLSVPVRTGPEGRAYVTAPPDCPTGTWTSRAHYEFEDGGKTDVTSDSPCTRPADPQPVLRVTVDPRRVPAGTRATFRVVVRSSDPRCVRRARVRLAGRHVLTGSRGRARVRAKFARPGRRAIVVSHAGCRTARTTVRVTPR